MNFIELAKDRFSVREFSPRPVEDEKIKKILDAAKVAPTAVNYQPQKLYVIKSPEAMEKLAGCRNIFGAPLAVIICYDDTLSWKNSRDNGHDSGADAQRFIPVEIFFRRVCSKPNTLQT